MREDIIEIGTSLLIILFFIIDIVGQVMFDSAGQNNIFIGN